MKDWKKYRLGEMIQCNPHVKLEKGKIYNLIDIDSIEIGSRYVKGKELTEYEGQSGRQRADLGFIKRIKFNFPLSPHNKKSPQYYQPTTTSYKTTKSR